MLNILVILLVMVFIIVKVVEKIQTDEAVTQIKKERAELGIVELEGTLERLIKMSGSRTGSGGPG